MAMWGFRTALCCAALAAGRAEAATLMVGPGQPYATPSAAAAAVQSGDTVSIAAGTYTDCAVWNASNLTIAGAGMSNTVIGNQDCAGKGVFVIYGNNVTVRDLALIHASDPDLNGAGIRAEGVNLTVQRVHIMFNQDGILADPIANSTIWIRDSYFYANGYCASSGEGCAHGIYIGQIAHLLVEHNTFKDTQIGHHIKSRAAVTDVIDNTIEDGPTGTSSYLIDVPNGGAVTIRGNRLEKGPLSSNPGVAISIGEEGVTWPTPALLITDNVFRDDGAPTTFVVNDTSTPAQLVANTFEGSQTTPLQGLGTVN